MEEAAIDVFVYGLAAGLSPIALIATVILLTGSRGRTNGLMFLAGYVVVIAATYAVIVLGADRFASPQGNPTLESLIELVIGLVLLAAAWMERPWKERAVGQASRSERLFAKLDGLSAPAAFGAGAVIVLSPKRLAITVLTAVVIASSGLTLTQDLVLDGIYVLTASALVWLAVLAAFLGGPKAAVALASLRTSALDHAQVVVFTVSLCFGLLFTGSAVLAFAF